MTRAYVGLGSNLGDSPGIVREAFERLKMLGSNFVNSDLYITEPWGRSDQPRFTNAVAGFDTDIEPQQLVKRLKAIEVEFGRTRGVRWGPRTLDLDLLLYGGVHLAHPECTVPHPYLRGRAFVLAPLAEIAPHENVPPDGQTVLSLWRGVSEKDRNSVRRLNGTATPVAPPRLDYDAPNGAGQQYDTLRPFSTFDRTILQAVLEATGPLEGKRVLDVGCGTGRFSHELAQAGAIVTGLDPSETMLAAARTREPAGDRMIEYVRADANGEMMPGRRYDLVTAFYCVQYIDVAQWSKRVIDLLEPDGAVVVATFPHRHFAETEWARFFPSLAAIDMARFPSVPAIQNMFVKAGFTSIHARDVLVPLEDDPSALIARVEAKYLSSFFLLPDEEFRAGLAAMRERWGGQRGVHRTARGVVISARRRGEVR